MDTFELNKLIGAALGTVFVLFSVSLISDAIFSTHAPETPGYAIAALEPEAGEGAGAAEEADIVQEVFPLLASADTAAGEALFRRCAACHTVEQGGANKIGPNLWNIVNRPVASAEGFSYSAAMREFAGDGTTWTFEHLTRFLADPKGYVRGTSMSFAGLRDAEDLANMVAYLNTLSSSPAELPSAPAAGEVTDSGEAESGGEAAATQGQASEEDEPAAEGSDTAPPAEAEGETAPEENRPAQGATGSGG
jgi:cytochrome c